MKRLALSVLLLTCNTGAWAEMVNGVQLPSNSEKVAENRYRVHESFEGAVKYFKGVYPPTNYPRKNIINQPGIKAFHISNPAGRNFSGLDVYENNEEVRVFILPVSKANRKR